MSEFKVGDRVRVRAGVNSVFHGEIGEIIQDDGSNTDRYLVKFGSPGRAGWKAAHEIELFDQRKEPMLEMTPPLSIPALLAKGEAILRDKAERQRAYKEDSAKKLVHSWNALVIAARLDLGFDLCATAEPKLVPGKPPPMWAAPDLVHINLRPFGAGIIAVAYVLHGHGESVDKASIVCQPKTSCPQIAVEQDYRLGHDGGVAHSAAVIVYDLAEAVALCELQTQGYLDAKAEVLRSQVRLAT